MKYHQFGNQLLIVGFGSIAQAILPLIFRHIDIEPQQVTILTKSSEGKAIANEFGVTFVIDSLTPDNFEEKLMQRVKAGDFLLNLSVDVSSAALVAFCQTHHILYLDTCIEPWEGGYVDNSLTPSLRSNYAMRDKMLGQRKGKQTKKSTALVAHGANPGLVSHFVKQALLNLAQDIHQDVPSLNTQEEWAALACTLNVKSIHIAECDTQTANVVKRKNEFVNTWSIDGFIDEGAQPAELGWGTHEKHWPHDGAKHEFGSQCAIYLNRPGAATFVRTWTPTAGAFHGYLITHTEAISIADYFTLKKAEEVTYRPTVHFAYHPCSDAILSMKECMGNEWCEQEDKRILYYEITHGMDELGVLLMGHEKGAYWFGSQLSIEKARELSPYNNATSLQVAIGALSGMIWVMQHPLEGLVEPDEVDHKSILAMASPYLGELSGFYTEWTPLRNRKNLFPETLDLSDPWQFINVRVN